MSIEFNLSPSSLNTYYESQLIFYFQYIEKAKPDTKVPTCYSLSGNIVHDVLDHNKDYWKDPKENFKHLWKERGLISAYGRDGKVLNPQLYWNAIQRGLHIIKTKYKIIGYETRFSFDFNERIKIKGIVDIIAEDYDGTIIIVDWKTSSSIDSGRSFERQGLFYATLYYKATGKVPTRAIFEYLKIDKTKEYRFTKDELDSFWKLINNKIKEIEKKGTDISLYSVGSINGPFNEYKQACMKEVASRIKKEMSHCDTKINTSGEKYKMRGYQLEATCKGVEFFNNPKKKDNSLIVVPVAGGKSLIIARVVKELKGRTVIFQPSKELLEQNYEKFINYGGEATKYSASVGQKEHGRVVFATIGSAIKDKEEFKNYDNFLIDEAHLCSPESSSMYMKFFNAVNKKVLGFTATPIRLRQYNYPEKHSKLNMLNRTDPHFFKKYLYVVQYKDLLDQGYLTPCNYTKLDYELKTLIVNGTGADYTTESIERFIKSNNILETIPILCEKHSDRKHGLIFVNSIEQGKKLQSILPNSEVVHSKLTSKQRDKIIKDFKTGIIKYAINVNVLAVGFDYPEIDLIIQARPTLSLAMHYQQLGRGVRLDPDKKDCLIIDLVGNCRKFGKLEDLTIENRGTGWGVYNKYKLLTGVPLA